MARDEWLVARNKKTESRRSSRSGLTLYVLFINGNGIVQERLFSLLDPVRPDFAQVVRSEKQLHALRRFSSRTPVRREATQWSGGSAGDRFHSHSVSLAVGINSFQLFPVLL